MLRQTSTPPTNFVTKNEAPLGAFFVREVRRRNVGTTQIRQRVDAAPWHQAGSITHLTSSCASSPLIGTTSTCAVVSMSRNSAELSTAYSAARLAAMAPIPPSVQAG